MEMRLKGKGVELDKRKSFLKIVTRCRESMLNVVVVKALACQAEDPSSNLG